MEAEPFSGVTVPLDVEAIAADPVEAGERSVELFAEVLREAGSVACCRLLRSTFRKNFQLIDQVDRSKSVRAGIFRVIGN